MICVVKYKPIKDKNGNCYNIIASYIYSSEHSFAGIVKSIHSNKLLYLTSDGLIEELIPENLSIAKYLIGETKETRHSIINFYPVNNQEIIKRYNRKKNKNMLKNIALLIHPLYGYMYRA